MAPMTIYADDIHSLKYRSIGETFRDSCNRVASILKDNDKHYHELREILFSQRFCPGGRIFTSLGTSKFVTSMNCYASGTISDSYTDDDGSIMQRAHEAAKTLRMGGGIGYNFSTIRPRGSLIKKLNSKASGPVSFMEIFNAIGKTTSSTGERRGAQMGILNIDHPDIEEFINAKHNNESLTSFNISIGVTDEFMEAVENQKIFKLKFDNIIYKEIDAFSLFETIMRSTWDWAEPGVIFLDTINKYNNLWYCEKIDTTNPCSEQPLPPFGACLLGSYALPKYLKIKSLQKIKNSITNNDYDTYPLYEFDYDLLKHDIYIVTRAMDNVIEKSLYPLPEQKNEQKNKRRLGIGITGLANNNEALGYFYGTKNFLELEEKIGNFITHETYRASIELAKEKGSFPLFDNEKYCKGKFIKTLPDDIQENIKKYGIRNSHLTSIAPTGTMSLTLDNMSSGIEPVFSYETTRNVETNNGTNTLTLKDYGLNFLNVKGKVANSVSVEEHIGVLLTAQKFVDSSISKTINCGDCITWEDFKNIYFEVWKGGGKGCSTFNINGKRNALLKENSNNSDNNTACYYDPNIGAKSCE